ncbi:hypothetical protein [Leucobacter sp. OH1287]|uniref:hypothetical protein n=1 Tax=Leucobacter sp. OH1287 TaxID=2491049 RepID=UPI0018F32E86|nr:hypothetical protein [Leucobacter sp. OH1287]
MSSRGKAAKRLAAVVGACAMLCGCVSSGSAMRHEGISHWSSYEVTGTHELTFTVVTGSPRCYGLRSVVEEDGDTLWVALVEGVLPEAGDECTMEAMYNKIKVTTESPAADLTVIPLPADEVELNR